MQKFESGCHLFIYIHFDNEILFTNREVRMMTTNDITIISFGVEKLNQAADETVRNLSSELIKRNV